MTRKTLAAFILVDFTLLNLAALYFAGPSGFIEHLRTMGWWGAVITTDVVIANLMVLAWVWRDARRSERNPVGYTILTLLTGSIGTLLYIATGREDSPRLSS